MKTTVIYHSADFDGLFCREIARKFLPDAELIGWDFGDKPLAVPPEGAIYILDLPVDRVFGLDAAPSTKVRYSAMGIFEEQFAKRIIWIDHHKSSIESHPDDIPGYRIDGVAACRLAWQWFKIGSGPDTTNLPDKPDYIDRKVIEPLAVRLAGEYDIRDDWREDWDTITSFQFGLRSRELSDIDWAIMLAHGQPTVEALLKNGHLLQRYQQRNDASTMRRSFLLEFEGLKFLALNTARCNSLAFAAKDVPETGHDALMGFCWDGKTWTVSLYHANHRKDLDLSLIASKHFGGGHRGACGFQIAKFPFIL